MLIDLFICKNYYLIGQMLPHLDESNYWKIESSSRLMLMEEQIKMTEKSANQFGFLFRFQLARLDQRFSDSWSFISTVTDG